MGSFLSAPKERDGFGLNSVRCREYPLDSNPILAAVGCRKGPADRKNRCPKRKSRTWLSRRQQSVSFMSLPDSRRFRRAPRCEVIFRCWIPTTLPPKDTVEHVPPTRACCGRAPAKQVCYLQPHVNNYSECTNGSHSHSMRNNRSARRRFGKPPLRYLV
jgi:hypothetical protein